MKFGFATSVSPKDVQDRLTSIRENRDLPDTAVKALPRANRQMRKRDAAPAPAGEAEEGASPAKTAEADDADEASDADS